MLPVPYPFLNPSQANGEWIAWNLASQPLTITLGTDTQIETLWFPGLPGAVTIKDVNADTIYVTQASGAEVVPLPEDETSVSLTCTVSSGMLYVFASSEPFDPFRLGAIAATVTTVTATAPVASSGGSSPNISIETPLPVTYGGSGSAAPSIIAGTGIRITGTWPFQIVTALNAGTVTDVTASAPLQSSGGTTPNLSIETPIPTTYGGTGTATPGDVAGPGIGLTGTWPNQTISNTGAGSINGQTGSVTISGSGGIVITEPGGGVINADGTVFVETVTSTGGTVILTRSGQTVNTEVASKYIPAIDIGGNPISGAKMVIGKTTLTFTGSGTAASSVSLTGAAVFTSPPTVVATTNQNTTGDAVLVQVRTISTSSFIIDGSQLGGSGSGTAVVGFIAFGS